MMFKQGIGIAAFAGAALIASNAVHAASINDVIFNNGPADFRANDDSREDLYNADGTLDETGIINEGDTIAGILDIDTIDRFPQSVNDGENGSIETVLGNGTDNQELTGVFAIQVQSVNDVNERPDDPAGIDRKSYVFGPDPSFSNGEGTVVRFYGDSSKNFTPDASSRSDAEDTATDGNLLLEIGFRGDSEEFFVGDGPQDISNLSQQDGANGTSANVVATSNLVLNRTTNNGVFGNAQFLDRDGDGQFDGQTSIYAAGQNSPFRIQDNTDFSFSTFAETAVPTPTAGMAGIALLGLMGFVRRRKQVS